MRPQVSPQDTHRRQEPESDNEIMLSSRKKPVCHSCGHPMEGHKRPNGSPICPRDSATPSPSPSPLANRSSRNRSRSGTPAHYDTPPPPPRSLLSRISPRDVRSSPTPSGYWHRQNPNWVEPEHYSRFPQHVPVPLPQRGETPASWQSTELIESVEDLRTPEPEVHYVYGDDEEVEEDQLEDDEGEDTGSQRTVSPPPSRSITRFMSNMASMLGRSTPVTTEYSAPADEVFAIEHAAEKQGLYTRVVHRPVVKPEPESPSNGLSGRSQSLAREGSWRIFVGRDPDVVKARAESHVAYRPGRSSSPREPYDYDRGLDSQLNERVGTYPVDPRTIRQNFCDVIIAAVISAFCAVWFLSYM
ncbi:hypothetical protein BN946_scf185015.g160 [Trametes cinnabarina]|uniref:Uncharacterized protein n=1 Tax=Pycnoporus cinnabarinus TaxID=5643 RepID=A0A060SI49_PYCCI|nr:hypothetical protein BN946_scf185015.g160 [Trametes cinnabarina]